MKRKRALPNPESDEYGKTLARLRKTLPPGGWSQAEFGRSVFLRLMAMADYWEERVRRLSLEEPPQSEVDAWNRWHTLNLGVELRQSLVGNDLWEVAARYPALASAARKSGGEIQSLFRLIGEDNSLLAALESEVGRWRSRIAAYEAGRMIPSAEVDSAMNDILSGVSLQEIESILEPDRPIAANVTARFLGEVPREAWQEEDNKGATIELSIRVSSSPDLAAVRIAGASMRPLFQPGELVGVARNLPPAEGDIALVVTPSKRITLARVGYSGVALMLFPLDLKEEINLLDSEALGTVIHREISDRRGLKIHEH
ncbi:MAG: S24 family peptidase [Fimbriimonas sp.]